MNDLQAQVRSHTRFQHVTHVPECASTQVLASRDERPGCGIYWADHQTAGRGRHGRVWLDSVAQDLAVTFRVVEPAIRNPTHLAAAVPVAIAETLSPWTQATRIKWPNDVQVDGKKISGVLIDTAGQPPSTFHIGIGININRDDFHPEIQELATSLRVATGRSFDRSEVLLRLAASLSDLIEELLDDAQRPRVARAFRDGLGLVGHRVRAVTGDQEVIGTLDSIDLDQAIVAGQSIHLAHLQRLGAAPR